MSNIILTQTLHSLRLNLATRIELAFQISEKRLVFINFYFALISSV